MQRDGFVIKTESFWYLWCDLSAQTQTSSAILGAHVKLLATWPVLQQQLVLNKTEKFSAHILSLLLCKSEELLFLCDLRLLWKVPNSWD